MKIEGNHNCEHCNKDFDWFHQVPQKSNTRLDVETIPKGKIGLYRVSKSKEENGYKIPLEASVYCPGCDRLNTLIIK